MSKENREKIGQNTKDIVALKKDVEYIRATLDTIMNNHLQHIADDIKGLQRQVSSINVGRSSDAPIHKLIYKSIEYVILVLIGAVVVMVARSGVL